MTISLAIDNDEVLAAIATVCGWSRTGAELGVWAGTTNLEDAQRMIRNGQRDFELAHEWSFLNGFAAISTNAAYTTGTISVTAGTVTLSVGGQPWPSWATSAWLEYDGRRHAVTTRTSNSVLVLAETDHNASAGTGVRAAEI